MVKWYHKSLPSLRCGFDSRYPLQGSFHDSWQVLVVCSAHKKIWRNVHPFKSILVVIYALVFTQAFRVSSQTWPTSHCIAVSFPWLPHPSATANDVESISVKNATESAFMMRPFHGFNRDKISKNAYIFKYF